MCKNFKEVIIYARLCLYALLLLHLLFFGGTFLHSDWSFRLFVRLCKSTCVHARWTLNRSDATLDASLNTYNILWVWNQTAVMSDCLCKFNIGWMEHVLTCNRDGLEVQPCSLWSFNVGLLMSTDKTIKNNLRDQLDLAAWLIAQQQFNQDFSNYSHCWECACWLGL